MTGSYRNVKTVFVRAKRLSGPQQARIRELQDECFSEVSRQEVRECFFARGFGRVLAYQESSMVGQAELFLRTVFFRGMKVMLGGIGGTCVTSSRRHNGIGRDLVRKGLDILRTKKCDIACLNANVQQYQRGGLYYGLGFRVMNRKISFEDAHGRTRYDSGEMFIPLHSKIIYNSAMNGKETFHLGRGYW